MGWDGGGESTRGRWLLKGSTILVVGVVVALLVRSGFFEFEGDDMAAAWEVFPGVQKRIDGKRRMDHRVCALIYMYSR